MVILKSKRLPFINKINLRFDPRNKNYTVIVRVKLLGSFYLQNPIHTLKMRM